ncbi:unnamed protein product [Periconia digitata]|uniref:Zn(2)-C6 fungal-type domain-containing protein n=1 Tax=Periconia digitata TaxID=1303443 RepID=A0A9W4UUT2_9PLEO|nr:unnamed protein product [Periconia digitata]
MAPDEVKKRKACQSCIRAKAKCSPSTDQADICYRCQRLKKECVFEESVRKRGPKSRSRVKQLEQRVDSLIGLLAANGQSLEVTENIKSVLDKAATPTAQSEPSPGARDTSNSVSSQCHTPPESGSCQLNVANPTGEEPFEAYDPIDAGIITEHAASRLVEEFKQSFVLSFPFVVIPPSTDVNTLRRDSPFLFLSVLTTTSYRTPELQRELANHLKSQIALRVVELSHKSLEILQGLLVYGAWYHFFYRPANQQLAVIIQLCVAVVQDLALSKNPKENQRKARVTHDPFTSGHADRGSAGERAYLGTYYLAAAFAQAWRKRVTIQWTRYMAQCCRNVNSRQEYPSDVLILPLIQLSELMCRINDIFSYDDIGNAEVKGDMMIDMSITNLSSELDRIQDAVAPSVKENLTLNLHFRLLRIWIHECALHTSFWTPSSHNNSFSISPTRLKALRRCLRAMQSYVDALLLVPQSSLHHLSSQCWVGWFYAVIVACKLVFLEENERDSETDIEPTDQEVTKLMEDEFDNTAPQESYQLPTNVATNASWDAILVAQEANVQTLFEGFVKKMDFTMTKHPTDAPCECSDPLHSLLYLQRTLSHGFIKRMKELLAKANASADSNNPRYRPSVYQTNMHTATTPLSHFPHPEAHPQANAQSAAVYQHPAPLEQFNNNWNFNALNFDGFMMPESHQPDMLWDMVMDDFSMPPL